MIIVRQHQIFLFLRNKKDAKTTKTHLGLTINSKNWLDFDK